MTKLDPRSPEAMEAERRDLEQAKIHQPKPERHRKVDRARVKSDRFTTPAEAMGQLRKTMRARPGAPERLYNCGVCLDSGWMEINAEGRGTVARCRRGCEPPVRKEKSAGAGSKKATVIS